MNYLEAICNLLFQKKSVPDDFSEERYMTAYPDCNGHAIKHYKRKGAIQHRICYVKGDMGTRKQIATTDSPLISVVVTSYNYERFIATTIDSILSQTYKNFEIIVVDDGSTDSSIEIIERYTQKYPQIKLYRHKDQQNRGLIESMRLGVEKSQGTYVAFCESDDYWTETNLADKVDIINNYEDVVIISNAIKMFGNEDDIKARGWVCEHIRKLLKQGGTPIDLRYNQEFNFIPTLSSVMIRRDVLSSLNYDSPVPAWIDFWLYRQILKNHILYFVDKELTLWRQHNSFNGLSNSSKVVNRLPDFLQKSNTLIGL